jgi:hypothetical protein
VRAAAWAAAAGSVPAATLASHHAWLLMVTNCRPSSDALQAAKSARFTASPEARCSPSVREPTCRRTALMVWATSIIGVNDDSCVAAAAG